MATQPSGDKLPINTISDRLIMTKTFLQYVAKDLLAKHPDGLARVAVVFPNKRASLFLNRALAETARQAAKAEGHAVAPLWSPAYITISELFRHHSSLTVPQDIDLVFTLYQSYCTATGQKPNDDDNNNIGHFYGWGQKLLADFDDVDKNMAPVDKLFRYVEAYEDLGPDFADLSEEQRRSISDFFHLLNTNPTDLKQRFVELWKQMPAIYQQFHKDLESRSLAYEGMLYRSVVENENIEFQFDEYVFIGFNLLQKVEQELFRRLKKAGKARFYWDYDEQYLRRFNGDATGMESHAYSDAGRYIGRYLDEFPNELSVNRLSDGLNYDEIYRQMAQPKDITYATAKTETAQATYIAEWLQGGKGGRFQTSASHSNDCRMPKDPCQAVRTAIVLADESLLPQVIHSLPKDIGEVNITTGYPLRECPVSSFVNALLDLQQTGHGKGNDWYRAKQTKHVLRHPLARYIYDRADDVAKEIDLQARFYKNYIPEGSDYDGLRLLFSPSQNPDGSSDLIGWLCDILQIIGRHCAADKDPLLQESVYRMFTLMNRLHQLITIKDQPGIINDKKISTSAITAPQPVTMAMARRLINQLIQSTTVPFHGEPARGIQIMGVLETRNLDFDHVLLLSCTEGNLPKGVDDSSLIPHTLRKVYGLTTVENKVAIYAYYFYSLMQRATDITITYNDATDDGHKGEMSRFMLQWLIDYPNARCIVLEAGQKVKPSSHPTIAKSDRPFNCPDKTILDVLREKEKLSPTAINRYLRCPLQFYFESVCGLKQPEEEEDEIDARHFGTIFHKAAELIYDHLSNHYQQEITAENINALLKNSNSRQQNNSLTIRYFINRAFEDAFFNPKKKSADESILKSRNSQQTANSEPAYSGLQLINAKVIERYLTFLLQLDSQNAPFRILSLENSYEHSYEVGGCRTTPIKLHGYIDRLDSYQDDNGNTIVRIVDYKTGAPYKDSLGDVADIFIPKNIDKHSNYYLQTFLYSYIWYDSMKERKANSQSAQTEKVIKTGKNDKGICPDDIKLRPALLFIRSANQKEYNPVLQLKEQTDVMKNGKPKMESRPIDNILTLRQDFDNGLHKLLAEEIFNPNVSFTPTDDTKRCDNCPYAAICR